MRREPVVFGIDHARAPVELRERIAFRAEDLPEGLAALAETAEEGLILSTCNRTELYAVIERDRSIDGVRQMLADSRGVAAGTLDSVAHVYRGSDAVRHFYQVASGLESMVLGEPQILGQIRDALATAQAAGVAQTGMTRLATEALRTGKRVRTDTGLARNRLSIPHAAIALAAQEHEPGPQGQSVLVIGAGKMATLTAKLLRRDDVAELFIANRTPERGEELAAQVGGRAVPLSAIPDLLRQVDLVFGATEAADLIVEAGAVAPVLGARERPLLMIDLAVPRSIDHRLNELDRVRVLDVDDLEPVMAVERQRAEADIARAEVIIDAAVAEFERWWSSRPVTPAIASIQQRAEQIRTAELERALRKLSHLSERDREVIKALSVGIVNKMLHQPMTRLRHATGDDPAIGTVIELFGMTNGATSTTPEAGASPEPSPASTTPGERTG